MSDIALKWADSISLNHPTARKLLYFFASNHTHNNQIQITVRYLSTVLQTSKTTILRAKGILLEKKLISNQSVFDDDTGAQLPSIISLNISQTLIETTHS